MDALRFAVFKVVFRAVVYGNLSFDIDAQFIGISFGKFINLIAKHSSVGYGCWHIFVRFAASKAKHYALISSADLAAFLIDALVYIRALLIYADFYLDVVWVQALLSRKFRLTVVADFSQCVFNDTFVVFKA